jgi:hypothetical protein
MPLSVKCVNFLSHFAVEGSDWEINYGAVCQNNALNFSEQLLLLDGIYEMILSLC